MNKCRSFTAEEIAAWQRQASQAFSPPGGACVVVGGWSPLSLTAGLMLETADTILRVDALAQHQRPNTVRVAKCHQAIPHNHHDYRIGALASSMQPSDCVKDILRPEYGVAATHKLHEFVRKHIQQNLGV